MLVALGWETCRAADFPIGESWSFANAAGWEARDTADLEVCATSQALCVSNPESTGIVEEPLFGDAPGEV